MPRFILLRHGLVPRLASRPYIPGIHAPSAPLAPTVLTGEERLARETDFLGRYWFAVNELRQEQRLRAPVYSLADHVRAVFDSDVRQRIEAEHREKEAVFMRVAADLAGDVALLARCGAATEPRHVNGALEVLRSLAKNRDAEEWQAFQTMATEQIVARTLGPWKGVTGVVRGGTRGWFWDTHREVERVLAPLDPDRPVTADEREERQVAFLSAYWQLARPIAQRSAPLPPKVKGDRHRKTVWYSDAERRTLRARYNELAAHLASEVLRAADDPMAGPAEVRAAAEILRFAMLPKQREAMVRSASVDAFLARNQEELRTRAARAARQSWRERRRVARQRIRSAERTGLPPAPADIAVLQQEETGSVMALLHHNPTPAHLEHTPTGVSVAPREVPPRSSLARLGIITPSPLRLTAARREDPPAPTTDSDRLRLTAFDRLNITTYAVTMPQGAMQTSEGRSAFTQVLRDGIQRLNRLRVPSGERAARAEQHAAVLRELARESAGNCRFGQPLEGGAAAQRATRVAAVKQEAIERLIRHLDRDRQRGYALGGPPPDASEPWSGHPTTQAVHEIVATVARWDNGDWWLLHGQQHPDELLKVAAHQRRLWQRPALNTQSLNAVLTTPGITPTDGPSATMRAPSPAPVSTPIANPAPAGGLDERTPERPTMTIRATAPSAVVDAPLRDGGAVRSTTPRLDTAALRAFAASAAAGHESGWVPTPLDAQRAMRPAVRPVPRGDIRRITQHRAAQAARAARRAIGAEAHAPRHGTVDVTSTEPTRALATRPMVVGVAPDVMAALAEARSDAAVARAAVRDPGRAAVAAADGWSVAHEAVRHHEGAALDALDRVDVASLAARDGWTVAHEAASHHPEAALRVIEREELAVLTDRAGETAAHTAVRANASAALHAVLRPRVGALRDGRDRDARSVAELAVEQHEVVATAVLQTPRLAEQPVPGGSETYGQWIARCHPELGARGARGHDVADGRANEEHRRAADLPERTVASPDLSAPTEPSVVDDEDGEDDRREELRRDEDERRERERRVCAARTTTTEQRDTDPASGSHLDTRSTFAERRGLGREVGAARATASAAEPPEAVAPEVWVDHVRRRAALVRVDVDGVVVRPTTPAGATAAEVRISGLLHRHDGPAVVEPDSTRYFYLNGIRHRAGGPAVERPDPSQDQYFRQGVAQPMELPPGLMADRQFRATMYEAWKARGFPAKATPVAAQVLTSLPPAYRDAIVDRLRASRAAEDRQFAAAFGATPTVQASRGYAANGVPPLSRGARVR